MSAKQRDRDIMVVTLQSSLQESHATDGTLWTAGRALLCSGNKLATGSDTLLEYCPELHWDVRRRDHAVCAQSLHN